MEVAQKIRELKAELPAEVCLVAVSKTKPDELIMEAYEGGHRDFGENKVQDLAGKAERLPKNIRWHMIGHLQTNKIKYIAPFVHLIHGVDSLKLLFAINKEALKNQRIIDVLLQVKIANEDSKFGLGGDEILALLALEEFKALENVRLRGLMGMATYTENSNQIRTEFQSLKRIFEKIKATNTGAMEHFDQRSFGMSADYRIAVEEGSTMVRIGSLIFGLRSIQNT